ncbi:MAG: hypothetical protein RL653_3708 [Pseudomonadota bacterium]
MGAWDSSRPMATLRIRRGSETSPTLTLELEGRLDAASATRLRDALLAHEAPEVTVDFSRVRDFQDAAVAVMSPALVGRAHRLLGLGPHQARVCRCFGLTAEPQNWK